LFIKEYLDDFERNYSYHWQRQNGELIARWDNSPHHKHLITFPHQCHINEKVIESYDISYQEILLKIEDLIKN
jgi:hypothetical protein